MAANTPFQLVQQGPRFTPLRFGLLSAAQIVDDADVHWEQGVKFQPDVCGPDRSISSFCIAGGPATGTPSKTPTATGAGSSAAEPYTVYAYTDCSPVGWGDGLEDMVARATRHLDAGEGRAVEKVFWTGTPDGGPVVHPHLAHNADVFATPEGPHTLQLQSAATVVGGGTPVDPLLALAVLEGALGECYGGEGVIHIPRRAGALLAEKGVIEAQGPQMRTKLGTIVAMHAFGSRMGPDHTTPAAGIGWFYGTGAVQIRRSKVKPQGLRPADFVGRTDNSTVYVVERTYVHDWDCCHLAVQVNGLGSP